MNHADAGLPPDCGGGGSTTFASENLGEIKLKTQHLSAMERFRMEWRLKCSFTTPETVLMLPY